MFGKALTGDSRHGTNIHIVFFFLCFHMSSFICVLRVSCEPDKKNIISLWYRVALTIYECIVTHKVVSDTKGFRSSRCSFVLPFL